MTSEFLTRMAFLFQIEVGAEKSQDTVSQRTGSLRRSRRRGASRKSEKFDITISSSDSIAFLKLLVFEKSEFAPPERQVRSIAILVSIESLFE